MIEKFEINFNQIDKQGITIEEKNFREKNLEIFNSLGFPNKKLEDWKFSDFKDIINKNFDQLDTKKLTVNTKKINLIKDFEHNYIVLVNGNLHSSNFDYEDKEKIKINLYKNELDYQISQNPLVCLNHALAESGYNLTIEKNYKFKKVLVIYNFFEKNLKNKIVNNKNKITVKENSEVHLIEYTMN